MEINIGDVVKIRYEEDTRKYTFAIIADKRIVEGIEQYIIVDITEKIVVTYDKERISEIYKIKLIDNEYTYLRSIALGILNNYNMKNCALFNLFNYTYEIISSEQRKLMSDNCRKQRKIKND